MGTLANFQQNRGTSKQQHAVARIKGDIEPKTTLGDKLSMRPFDHITSDIRFRKIVDRAEQDVSAEMSGEQGDAFIPEWMQEATKGKAPGKASSGQFMELFVYAAKEGNLAYIQTALKSRLRFYYIRLMLLGEAMEGDLRDSTLPKLLKERTPRGMAATPLDEAVRKVILEIGRRDSGLLLDLVERQSYLDEDPLTMDPRDKLIRDTIGAVFNLFFQWIAVIIASHKIAKKNKILRRAVMEELIVEYDEYVLDYVLPLAKNWGLGDLHDGKPDEEIGIMTEMLKGLRDYIHKSMCDIATQLEAESDGQDPESTDVMRMLWAIQRKSVLDVWGQGIWTLEIGAPIATMRRKGSQMSSGGQEVKKSATVIKLLSKQRVELEAQLSASVTASSYFVEATINIGNIMCRVANASWDPLFMGHFPSCLQVTVTPTTAEALFSVNRSTANQAFKVNRMENFNVGLGLGLSNNVGGAIQAGIGVGSQTGTSGTPWIFEQLEEGENGGSFIWSLTSWEGKPFDRLNPGISDKKTSIFNFGRRPPSNPLLGLPFGSDGGILFTEDEYSEGLKWRFPKHMEGSLVGWMVEGCVDTTIVTKKGYWETRTLYFEHALEQELIPDPDEPDKKDKKKKKKKNK